MEQFKKLDYKEIHDKFANSSYGETLNKNVRFSRFKPENVSLNDWVKMLGADVNNLNHLLLTFGLARNFIGSMDEDLSLEDKRILCLTAITHDWAESVTGDIPFPEKTKNDEKNELKILKHLLYKFLSNENYENQIQDKELDRVCNILSGNDELSLIFKTVEEIGYLRTGLNAWRKIDTYDNQELNDSLLDLALDVVNHNLAPLIDRSKKYPQLINFLINSSDIISEIILSTPRDIQHSWYNFLLSLDDYLIKESDSV